MSRTLLKAAVWRDIDEPLYDVNSQTSLISYYLENFFNDEDIELHIWQDSFYFTWPRNDVCLEMLGRDPAVSNLKSGKHYYAIWRWKSGIAQKAKPVQRVLCFLEIPWTITNILMISANLKEALYSLQDPQQDKLVWVDQLCIDQQNDVEKQLQISRLRNI